VSVQVQEPQHLEFVPFGIAPLAAGLDSSLQLQDVLQVHSAFQLSLLFFAAQFFFLFLFYYLQTLRWMLQKEKLEQDMFLIGYAVPLKVPSIFFSHLIFLFSPPGPFRRWIAFKFE
jgi:hypothetical protein